MPFVRRLVLIPDLCSPGGRTGRVSEELSPRGGDCGECAVLPGAVQPGGLAAHLTCLALHAASSGLAVTHSSAVMFLGRSLHVLHVGFPHVLVEFTH